MEGRQERPIVVYLDMNVWVSMARGSSRGDQRWTAARFALEEDVSRGQAGVPSSLPSTSDVLGHGAAHAFGSPHGRFRFVESLTSADSAVSEGQAVVPPPPKTGRRRSEAGQSGSGSNSWAHRPSSKAKE